MLSMQGSSNNVVLQSPLTSQKGEYWEWIVELYTYVNPSSLTFVGVRCDFKFCSSQLPCLNGSDPGFQRDVGGLEVSVEDDKAHSQQQSHSEVNSCGGCEERVVVPLFSVFTFDLHSELLLA